jgi:phage/plasmid-associated DNA primase
MALLGINPFHKVLLVTGEAASGKSTLAEVIELMIGQDNVATLVAERLHDRFELSGFLGKTLLIAKDVSDKFLQSDAVHVIKSLSGDRGIKVELKHSNRRMTLNGPFNILINSNADLLVELQGDADAWQRRLVVLNFNPTEVLKRRKMPKPKPITDLARELFTDEGPAILNWMLAGAWNITQAINQHQSFPMTAAQQQRTTDLLADSDPIKKFIDETMEKAPGSDLSTAAIYAQYDKYCDEKVLNALEYKVFTRQIKSVIFRALESKHDEVTDSKGKRAKGYRNVRFKVSTGTAAATGGAANGAPANGKNMDSIPSRQHGTVAEMSKPEPQRN